MNLFLEFDKKIKETIKTFDFYKENEVDLSRAQVEPPRDASHGDLSSNVAMILAKQVGQNPRALAEQIAKALAEYEEIFSVDVAGPGFINMRLTQKFWAGHLKEMVEMGQNYGRVKLDNPRNINVEYVSANPTGPMHVGHCRGAVVGDAMANLLEFAGYQVTREYYVNDAGGQINVLAKSVYLRYLEALGEKIGEIPEGLYPGQYLVPLGEQLAKDHGDGLKTMSEEDRLALIKPAAIDAMLDLIRDDLKALKVEHDVFFSERDLHANNGGKISAAIEHLMGEGFIYKGTLPPPKGKQVEDWEDREQTLFRSTDVGDDSDRALIKSDGSYTYFAADVAYFIDKFERGFNEMIFILGADHAGYVKRLQAVAKAVSGGAAEVNVRLCNLVKLFRGGEPIKMSKRSGNMVTLREVVDEVGSDAVRFMMLYRKNDAPLDFDFAKVTEQSRDNPVFYVQYAHARCHSIFRQLQEVFPQIEISVDVLKNANFERASSDAELTLIKKMAEYPRLIMAAADHYEPHRLAFYLHELAAELHSFWAKGKESPELRFINDNDAELTTLRIALVFSVASILASGLSIIGAGAPKEL